MVTAAVWEEFPWPSFTTREKVSVLVVAGAVKVGFALEELLRVTAGLAVWLQENVRVSPSTSVLAVPSRVTVAFLKTVCAVPALAVGGVFGLSPPPHALTRKAKRRVSVPAIGRLDPFMRKAEGPFF